MTSVVEGLKWVYDAWCGLFALRRDPFDNLDAEERTLGGLHVTPPPNWGWKSRFGPWISQPGKGVMQSRVIPLQVHVPRAKINVDVDGSCLLRTSTVPAQLRELEKDVVAHLQRYGQTLCGPFSERTSESYLIRTLDRSTLDPPFTPETGGEPRDPTKIVGVFIWYHAPEDTRPLLTIGHTFLW